MQISRVLALIVAALSLAGCAAEEPSEDPVVVVAFDDTSDEPNVVRDRDDTANDDDEDPVDEPEPDPDPDTDDDDNNNDVVEPSVTPNEGWIGGECAAANDCDFDNSVCLSAGDGHPGGECTQSCEGMCPNRDGENSQTFCMNDGDLGRCVSHCDTDLFGFRGCREGYECQSRSRFGDRDVTTPVCVPRGTPPEPPPAPVPCLEQLDNLGVDYRAWNYTTQYADGLACSIDDPIYVASPINGVEYRYFSESSPGEMAMACELALALHQLGDVLAPYDIVEVEHYGTFNCRKIGGMNALSMHGLGLAFDFYGFTDSSGDDFIFERDWSHNDANPTAPRAQMLRSLADDMWMSGLFNIILTPDFNGAHDNHIHADLTPGGNYFY